MDRKTVENIRRSLRRLNQSYGVFDEKTWEKFGITYALSQILFAISEAATPIAREICKVVQLEKSTLSRFLDQLYKKKLIQYSPLPDDARCKLISLTGKGHKLLSKLNEFGDEKTTLAFQGLSKEEIREIEQALTKLEKNLGGRRYL